MGYFLKSFLFQCLAFDYVVVSSSNGVKFKKRKKKITIKTFLLPMLNFRNCKDTGSGKGAENGDRKKMKKQKHPPPQSGTILLPGLRPIYLNRFFLSVLLLFSRNTSSERYMPTML